MVAACRRARAPGCRFRARAPSARRAPAARAPGERPLPPPTCSAGGSAASAACASALAVPMVPDFEVEKRPQKFFVILPALEMLVQHAIEGFRIVVGARARARARKVRGEVLAHFAAEPFIDRHAEADLRTAQDSARQNLARRAAQDPFRR